MTTDLHTHSNVSDGTDTPAELVRNAKAAGLSAVALTDHDTFDGLDQAVAEGERIGITVIRGMELSCQNSGMSIHLLMYGGNESDQQLQSEMTKVREGRSNRLRPVLAKLAELGVPVTEEAVLAKVGDSPSVGRPHIADALVEAGHVRDRQEAFDRFLADGGPAHVERYTIDVAHGIDLVTAAGGVPVIAHPWGRGREAALPPEYLKMLVNDHGLAGIEVDHQDHDPRTRAALRDLAGELGVFVTGSSDYHGTGKIDHDLGVNTTAPQVLAEIVGRIERSGV
ncbi:PHP domain-containing protein [Microlunatus sp. Gsoil 973]|uniref:PHP domain-containing protein n=1 Tax=Microlunatus sp. Gsoil 973 TaxID=2672569 RepID=UPI0012B4E444|nr:PHP domain-containing protein [Microlunatus sp. Gsoil 973]QGN32178.1 PHP domain-containing protein [Microlunatus sp. Gsoil 973]